MIIQGRTFEFVIASDVSRDGLGVELAESTPDGRATVAEVFRSDADGRMTFTAYEEDIPLSAIEQLLAEARRVLLPESDAV